MLRVTEVMHSPRPPDSGEMSVSSDTDDYKFIEIFNGGSETAGLTGVEFTKGLRFDFSGSPMLLLAPGEYAVVVKDRDAFAARYPGMESRVAGEFLGDLSGSGEQVEITARGSGAIVSFTYNDARDWPLASCGAGHSLVPLDAAVADAALLDYGGNWRASTYLDGSPGESDPSSAVLNLRLNEICAHTDLNDPAYPDYDSNDWIELYNAGETDVFIGNYYLSDDPNDLLKWRLPLGITLGSGEFITFDEITGFHSPYPDGFGIDKAGEQILLSYGYPGNPLLVADAVRFKGQANGVTLGRIADGTGCWDACVPTRGTANQAVAGHPVVSEIMYHPPDAGPGFDEDTFEYIEITNPSGTAVPMWELDGGSLVGSWRIRGDVEYEFPDATVLQAGERVLLVSFSPLDCGMKDAFVSHYSLAPSVVLYGPYDGKLSNRGGRVTLEKPQAPDLAGDDVSWVIVDEVVFFDDWPWTVPPDGMGYALHRAAVGSAATDPRSWMDGVPSPGSALISQPDLRINLFTLSATPSVLLFAPLPGLESTLESTTNLTENVWEPRAGLLDQAGYAVPRAGGPKSEFYRLRR